MQVVDPIGRRGWTLEPTKATVFVGGRQVISPPPPPPKRHEMACFASAILHGCKPDLLFWGWQPDAPAPNTADVVQKADFELKGTVSCCCCCRCCC